MVDFDRAICTVLQHEDPGLTGAVEEDTGGVTRWGISAHSYPHLDIRELSLEEAEAIYKRDYWYPLNCGAIRDQAVATKLLDMGVNMGTRSAARLLQRACIVLGHALTADGEVGPVTVEAVNACDPAALVAELRSQSRDRYLAIIGSDPRKYGQYKTNWLARAEA
jgi:lysozyme family protein